MSDIQPFMVYKVEDSGEKEKLDFKQDDIRDYLRPEKVFIIVREDLKRIYIWKGTRANVRKRFIGSRIAVEVQDMLKKGGYHYCKVVSIDQGDELDEFLNAFGLESMEAEEALPDMQYMRNEERKKLEEEALFKKQEIIQKVSKMDEIKKTLDLDEKLLWIKNSTLKLTDNWIKELSKNKKYKDRLKELKNVDIEVKNYEIRYVITNKKIILNSIYSKLYDFSKIPENRLKLKGEIVILDLRDLRSFEIEASNGSYDIWFNSEPINKGDRIFLFEGLSSEDYENFIDVFTVLIPYRAEIPKNMSLKFIPKKP